MSKLYSKLKGHSKKLAEIAKRASEKAIRESKALNLTITYMENGILYRENPDGTRKEIKKYD